MDDTIDASLVYAKTPKGVAEINARSGALTLQARRVLIMIDGRRPVAELMAVVRSGEFDGIMSTLESQGMIEKVDVAALPARNLEEEDFADTISLLQENASALRGMPQFNPAAVAQQATQARPATVNIEQNPVASTDAAALAARAVATASAVRPSETPLRRPPTITADRPPTITAAHPVNNAASNETAPPTVRQSMMSGTARVPDPVRRPPTLSGARPAAASAEPAAAAAVVEATPRSAPPTVRVEAPAPVAAAPVANAAAASAPAAPAPATTAPTRTLEEEKRFAVSELYSVLGPYGEQPAAKLLECTTMEALREQIKNAGRRVATFRGEKAAQDYLRAVGYA